jgi:hypothetical protein
MNTEEFQISHMADLNENGTAISTQAVGEDVPDINSLPNYLKEWILLEEEIKTLTTAVKERRKRMQMLQGLIMKTMKGHKISRVNIKAGAILYQNKSTKESMTKKFIVNNLTDYFKGDAAKAQEVFDFLEGKRAKKEKDNIKLEKL